MDERLQHAQRFIKFLVVGGVGFVINLVLLKVLSDTYHWNHSFANLVGAAAAIASNFNFNNLWTFQDRRLSGVREYFWKLFQFYAASAFGVIVLQTGVIFLGDRLIGEGTLRVLGFGLSYYVLYFLGGTALLVLWNFFAYSTFIWRKAAAIQEMAPSTGPLYDP